MRIMVLGAGALGGYFGARLQVEGHDVTFVARGAHLKAMQDDGLTIESPLGNLGPLRVRAVPSPADAESADLVLFMVKNYDVEYALDALQPVLGEDTLILTVQNGVLAPELVSNRIGAARVLPGAVYMPADIKAPGVIRHSADIQRIVLGALGKSKAEAAQHIASAISATGIEAEVADDPIAMLWEKFILMSANSAITALTRLDIGPLRETPASRALLRQLIDEAAAVAMAEHPELPDGAADRAFQMLVEVVPATMHASMQDDLVRGKRLELDWLSGDIVRRGNRNGIATPAHAVVLSALAPFAKGGLIANG